MHATRIVTVFLLGALQASCSSARLPARYAHCDDLGTLRLASTSADDAEDRMRTQVAILGGDPLLFNATGRTEDGDGIPSALAQRRIALAAAPAVSINGRQPELAALEASVQRAPSSDETRWYYGAALSCNRNDTGFPPSRE